eukprot:COSAG02_NODE_37239_length_444_cov_1.072464_1_plen_23_part_01
MISGIAVRENEVWHSAEISLRSL